MELSEWVSCEDVNWKEKAQATGVYAEGYEYLGSIIAWSLK
jgi:hypothetical protein